MLAGEVLLTEWDLSHLYEMGNAHVRKKLFEKRRLARAQLRSARAQLRTAQAQLQVSVAAMFVF